METNKTVIKLERHEWPDEKQERLKREKKLKKQKRLNNFKIILVLVCGLLIGAIFGYNYGNQNIIIDASNDNSKIDAVRSIMENDWFFADQENDLATQLEDKALYGMSQFTDVDKHTTYFTAAEAESFTTSINMNYTGIGVQYTTGDVNIVAKVFADSPAEKAGIQVGDILETVDGVSLTDKTSDEIKELVTGVKGTEVTIGVRRLNEYLELTAVRDDIENTAFGYMIDDDTAYLEIYSFGASTYEEAKTYLQKFQAEGMKNLLLDLRDDGGGYLTSVKNIAGLFLDSDAIVINQISADGSSLITYADGDKIEGINGITILVNGNTASAAEVLTLALKEQRDDVTLVGEQTYGKGTVQVTKSFSDGSALKYTNSKWESSKGVWVNGVGITPDVVIAPQDILAESLLNYSDGEADTYAVDSVSGYVKVVQDALDFLGYQPDRTDGYFSENTMQVLKTYQSANNLDATGIIDEDTYYSLISDVKFLWASDYNYDNQIQACLEILNA